MTQTFSASFRALALAIAALPLCVSCKPARLDAAGNVRLWIGRPDAELQAAAARMPGLSLSVVPKAAAWDVQLRDAPDSIDILFLDWERNLSGENALLAPPGPYRRRMDSPARLWPCLSRSDSYGDPRFLPATAYTWGLFYNRGALASRGLAVPDTWAEFESDLEALQRAGVRPIALGSSFGWPATAWLSYLDLRLNGAERHRDLLAGKRAFGSKDLIPVYETLRKWRDEGWIDPDSGAKNWTEAMDLVAEGGAAFVLLPASAWPRFPNASEVGFAAVPAGPGKRGGRGELVGVQGFALSAGARDPEAALALADAYIASGAPGQTAESFRVSSLRPAERKARGGSTPAPDATGANDAGGANRANGAEPSLAETEIAILRLADVAFPQMDRALGEQAAYGVNRIMTLFFAPGSTMGPAELATALSGATKGIAAADRKETK